MIKNITNGFIKDNEVNFTLDKNQYKLPLYLEYDDFDFQDLKATIDQKIDPFSDQIYFTDLKINDNLYYLKSDLANIYQYEKGNRELNVAGEFDIILNKATFSPTRNIYTFDNQKFNNVKFGGFRFDYAFKDNFAKPSSFYLAIKDSETFNISNQKAQKQIEMLKEIMLMAHFKQDDISQYEQAILSLDLNKLHELEQELNNAFQRHIIITKIKSFYKDKQLIVYYQGNKNAVKKLLNLDNKNEVQITRAMKKSHKTKLENENQLKEIAEYHEQEEDMYESFEEFLDNNPDPDA